MNSAKFTTTSGYSWTTDINGSLSDVADYLLGKMADVGVYPVEKMEKVVSLEMRSAEDEPMGRLEMKERDKITQKDVLSLLDIHKNEAIEMAKHCEKHAISGLCEDCFCRVECRRVDSQLMAKPVMNGREVGCYYMSDLLYQNHQLREEYR